MGVCAGKGSTWAWEVLATPRTGVICNNHQLDLKSQEQCFTSSLVQAHLCAGGKLVEEHGTVDGAKVEHVSVLQAVVLQPPRLARHYFLAPLPVLVQRKCERA